jgi:hypothetical protein
MASPSLREGAVTASARLSLVIFSIRYGAARDRIVARVERLVSELAGRP